MKWILASLKAFVDIINFTNHIKAKKWQKANEASTHAKVIPPLVSSLLHIADIAVIHTIKVVQHKATIEPNTL